jgi:hypothetical protein
MLFGTPFSVSMAPHLCWRTLGNTKLPTHVLLR